MTIDELLTAIDDLRKAYEEWANLEVAYQGTSRGAEYRQFASRLLATASLAVMDDFSQPTYDALTTLADEIRRLQARITELETFGDPVMLLEHAQMKARIEAAAAIPARDYNWGAGKGVGDEEFLYGNASGANEMRAEFRKALELVGK